MSYLLDTCVLIELGKSSPHPAVVQWARTTPEDTQFISVISVGELERAVCLAADAARPELDRVQVALLSRLASRTIPISAAVMIEWARGAALLRIQPRGANLTIGVFDTLIGATARVHHLTVATTADSTIRFTGADLIDPWHPQ